MSEINRVGLGIMLMLLISIGTIIAEIDLWVTFGYGAVAMVGYVLFICGKEK